MAFIWRLAVTILLLVGGGAKLDAEASSDSFIDFSLEELLDIEISSASDFSESPLTVASTVSLIEEQDWVRRGARRSNDAISHLPGVFIASSFAGGQSIKIRGFSILSPRGHSYLLDEVPLNSFAFNSTTYHMNHVGLTSLSKMELIRGPVSVQHGSDAFHGVVSMKSFHSDTPGTQVQGKLASNRFSDMGLRHTSIFGEHILNLSMQILQQGDQGQEFEWFDSGALETGKGSWARKEQYRMGILKLQSSNPLGWFYETGIYWKREQLDDHYGYGKALGRNLRENDLYSNKNSFHLIRMGAGYRYMNNLEIKLSTYKWNSSIEHPRWYDYNEFRTWTKNEVRSGLKLSLKQDNKAIETKWSLALVYDYAKVLDSNDLSEDANGTILSKTKDSYHGLERKVKSLVGQGTTALVSGLIFFNYGLRYDHYSAFGGQTSPRAGVVLQPAQKSALKLLYGQGFRAPSGGERGGFGYIAKGREDLEPETIDTYELVYLQQGDHWKSELVLFKSNWKNKIATITTSDPNYALEYTNEGESESHGIEMTVSAAWTTWNLDLSSSYIRSRDRSKDQDYVAFPIWIHNIGAGYRVNQDSLIYLSNRIETGAHQNIPEDSPTLKPFWKCDLHVSYNQDTNTSWSLDFTNLFNRKNKLVALNGNENPYPGDQFSANLTLKYQL